MAKKKSDTKAKEGRKRPPTKGSFKKGKSGNPKGRPRGSATIKAIKYEFNDNYKEMADVFKKYLEMSDKDFNKAVERANNPRTKTPIREILAIKYISDITKRGHTAKLDIVMGIITGTYGGGIADVAEYDLEKTKLSTALIKYSKSDAYRENVENVNADVIARFIQENPNMSPTKLKALEFSGKMLLKAELSRFELVKRSVVQDIFNKILVIMRDTVGRVNPRLLMDMVYRMHEDVSGTLELPKSMYSIEEDKTVEVKPKRKAKKAGRPKGSKDSKPRVRKK